MSATREWSTRSFLILALIIVAAGVLRWLFIGAKSLDLDEAYSVALARYDWPALLRTVTTSEANMGLYFALLHFWLSLGRSETIIRTLSVLPAVAAVPALYSLGARLFDRRVGLIGALLLSFNAFHVKYAQEARGYSLVMFLVTLSSLIVVRSIERPSRTHWTGYILTSVLGVYTHVFAALVLVSQWASLVFLRRRDVPIRGLLVSLVITGSLLLPLAAFALTRDVAHFSSGVARPQLSNIPGVFYALAGSTERLRHPSVVGIVLMLAYLGLCFIAAVNGVRTWALAKASFETWRYGFLLTWLCLPVALAFAISLVKPLFVAFYLIVCLPPLVLLVAAGLASIRSRRLFGSAVTVIVLLAGHQIYTYYTDFSQKEDFRGATSRLLSLASPGDAVVFYAPYGRDGFDYYRERFAPAPRIVILQKWEDVSPHYPRVWLFVNSGYDTRAIQASLARQYSTEQAWTYPGITLFLYANSKAGWLPPGMRETRQLVASLTSRTRSPASATEEGGGETSGNTPRDAGPRVRDRYPLLGVRC